MQRQRVWREAGGETEQAQSVVVIENGWARPGLKMIASTRFDSLGSAHLRPEKISQAHEFVRLYSYSAASAI
jgi:hypothetical protein